MPELDTPVQEPLRLNTIYDAAEAVGVTKGMRMAVLALENADLVDREYYQDY